VLDKEEWTQEEYLDQKAKLATEGVEVVLVDTILKPLKGAQSITYNPFEMKKYPKGTVFVLYCDTGKVTHDRISEYRKKFPDHHCVSLRGGRGYWRATLNGKIDQAILEESLASCKI
jgi:hypothetical protein